MSRDQVENYQQDRLGNVNRELDQLRAQEGMVGADDTDEGIQTIGSADTGTNVLVMSKPTHADRMILDLIHAHNSGSAASTFQIFEAELDNAGNITATTRRSVPLNVAAGATRAIGYEGTPFENAIAVNSGFEGEIGLAVISDHDQSSEPNIEQTQ